MSRETGTCKVERQGLRPNCTITGCLTGVTLARATTQSPSEVISDQWISHRSCKRLRLAAFAHRLDSYSDIKKFDDNGEIEAWILATAFAEFEQFAQKFLKAELPRLVDPTSGAEESIRLLTDLGEDLRHFLSHFSASRFFRYVFDERFPGASFD